MERCYSLKSEVANIAEMEERLFDLTESLGTEFEQVDVYFRCTRGTLKMRNMPPSPEGQLISTKLVKSEGGRRLIENTTSVVDDVDALQVTLSASLGEIGTVRKSRRVFLLDDARIYLDDVKDIGRFLEVLVAIVPASPGAEETGEARSMRRLDEIASALQLAKGSSLPMSYIELAAPGTKRLPQWS